MSGTKGREKLMPLGRIIHIFQPSVRFHKKLCTNHVKFTLDSNYDQIIICVSVREDVIILRSHRNTDILNIQGFIKDNLILIQMGRIP